MTPVAGPASANRSYRRGAIRASANAAPPSRREMAATSSTSSSAYRRTRSASLRHVV
ncbi:MAG TPA: hypothetical protein VM759_02420 [Longimicrobium sp.]|nr:hypothetical protein [Longimicrobium sp.]